MVLLCLQNSFGFFAGWNTYYCFDRDGKVIVDNAKCDVLFRDGVSIVARALPPAVFAPTYSDD